MIKAITSAMNTDHKPSGKTNKRWREPKKKKIKEEPTPAAKVNMAAVLAAVKRLS